MAKKNKSVQRRVHFYRIDAGNDDAGKPLSYNTREVLKHLNGLSWKDKHWQESADVGTGCVIDACLKPPYCMRLLNLRYADLPLVEEAGKLKPLKIPAGAGLAEACHVVWFKDNIIGVEFNFYAPRASKLPGYFNKKAKEITMPFGVERLVRTDVLERLMSMKDVTLFRLKVRPSFAEQIATKNDSLGGAFEAASKAGNVAYVDIILRSAKNKVLGKDLLALPKELLGMEDLDEGALAFEVAGIRKDGDRDRINLLSDKLVASVTVSKLTDKSRAVDSKSCYDAIKRAYNGLKDELKRAVAVAVEVK